MHAWFHSANVNLPQRLYHALRPGGLLVIEGPGFGPGLDRGCGSKMIMSPLSKVEMSS